MTKAFAYLAAGLSLGGVPAAAAQDSADSCGALNYMLAQAKTEFPALKNSKVNAGQCSLVRREFRCQWGFPSDRFDAAKQQGARLMQCIAAQRGATALKPQRDEAGFQLNPDTTVHLRGPVLDSGEWMLTLRIDTTADWN